MQEARAQWSLTDPKVGYMVTHFVKLMVDGYMFIQASLEVAIDHGNQSAIVDVLSVLNLRRSLWTLDMALLVLPELRLIIRSNHNRWVSWKQSFTRPLHDQVLLTTCTRYVECACCTLKLLLRSFSAVISDNTNTPSTPAKAVDLAKEER